jgi:aspartate kinase
MVGSVQVHKFGGTSVATTNRDRHVLELALKSVSQDSLTFMVCSGAGKIDNTEDGRKATDHAYDIVNGRNRATAWGILKDRLEQNAYDHSLQSLCLEYLIGEAEMFLNSENLDRIGKAHIIGLPERFKAQIIYEVGKREHPELNWRMLDYKQCLMFAIEGYHENIDVPLDHTKTLRAINNFVGKKDLKAWEVSEDVRNLKGCVGVLPGFIGVNERREMVTLRRGMSDGTATYWGAGSGAEEVVIWSDNNGIAPVDPRIVRGLAPIQTLGYGEARAFAGLGAGILHEAAIRPAKEYGTNIRVRNTFNPEQEGTLITGIIDENHYGIKAIACIPGYEVIKVRDMPMHEAGIAAKVARMFADYGINIEKDVDGDFFRSYAVFPGNNIEELKVALEDAGHRTETEENVFQIALIGEGMNYVGKPGDQTAKRILMNVLDDNGVENLMESYAKGSVVLSAFVERKDGVLMASKLAQALGFN